ncbi:MAG: AraC family transcriptional regulator, partial [Solirubrobacteraceae bacterium]|nr:AraC family transcriptional regulator [Solirubrobacteraceae bacterium]
MRNGPDALSGFLTRLRFSGRSVESVRLEPGERRGFGSGDGGPGDSGDSTVLHLGAGSVSVSTAGTCALLQAGDVILLPRGAGFAITALAATDPERATADLLAVTVRPDAAAAGDLAALPALMMGCGLALSPGEPLVGSLLDNLRAESAAGRPGSSTIVAGLAGLLAASVVRTWFERGCAVEADDRLLALRDPHIARAVEAMHADPGAAWTVAELARVAASSRSAFAEQFRRSVGEPPLGYLARVRMERAKQLLGRDGLGVGRTAEALGYRSDEAFSRAFRRHVGVSPSRWTG